MSHFCMLSYFIATVMHALGLPICSALEFDTLFCSIRTISITSFLVSMKVPWHFYKRRTMYLKLPSLLLLMITICDNCMYKWSQFIPQFK